MLRRSAMVCGLLALAVGCGGDDMASGTSLAASSGTAAVSDTGNSASNTTEASAAAATTVEANTAVDLAIAPCDLVTADDVAAATGLPVVAVDDTTLGPTGCVFDLGLSADIFVEIEAGEGSFGGPEFLFTSYMDLVDGGTAELIPDVGVAAVYSPSFRGLAVDAGEGRFLAVGLDGGYPEGLAEPRETLIALASAAMARL